MNDGLTICAEASPPSARGTAIIRLSGERTSEAINSLGIDAPTKRGASNAAAYINGFGAVPVRLLICRAPSSATGEHTAELLIPAHRRLIDAFIRALCDCEGVREATAGEYSARAFMHGCLTLDQAEGVARTIAATSDAELIAAGSLRRGEIGERVRAVVEQLSDCLALLEAGIDFADQEDVTAIENEEVMRISRDAVAALQRIRGRDGPTERVSGEPRIVLFGNPNAGKTSLFNALLGRSRAIPSEIAGATRDVLAETITFDTGGTAILMDLPGADESDSSQDTLNAISQSRMREALSSADLALWCDPSGKFQKQTFPIELAESRIIRVRTKADTLCAPDPEADITPTVSALSGVGLVDLKREVQRRLTSLLVTPHAAMSERIRSCLEQASTTLDELSEHSRAEEISAASIRAALDSLAPIVGAIPPDEILGKVFSTFCVGK